jgi:hypothetical protein
MMADDDPVGSAVGLADEAWNAALAAAVDAVLKPNPLLGCGVFEIDMRNEHIKAIQALRRPTT